MQMDEIDRMANEGDEEEVEDAEKGEEEEDEDEDDDDEGDDDDDEDEDEDEDDEANNPFGDQFQDLEDAIYRFPLGKCKSNWVSDTLLQSVD